MAIGAKIIIFFFVASNLRDLLQLNIDFSLWYELGEELGLEEHQLNTIKADNAGKPKHTMNCATDMFLKWIETDYNPTYEKLAVSLSTVGMREIAATLCEKHGKYYLYEYQHFMCGLAVGVHDVSL